MPIKIAKERAKELRQQLIKPAKGMPLAKSEFTYPELRRAERSLYKIAPEIRGTRPVEVGSELRSFGPELMKNPDFRKQLRKFQEKHRITVYT